MPIILRDEIANILHTWSSEKKIYPEPAASALCEECSADNALPQPIRSNYGGEKELILCANCAKDYHDYWDEMWAIYSDNSL